MKSYRFLGEEAEVLGTRLDAARKSLAGANSAWAKNYWTQTIERLLFQWQQLPALHDAEAMVTIIPRWTISYDYIESGHRNEGFGITDRAFYKVFRQDIDLSASWHNHREARLARAQY
jgi:hypothetical protein